METQKQSHPTEQFLAAFALGKLTPESHGRMQRHLAACAECSSFIVQTPHDTLVALMKNVTASRISDQSTAGIKASETLAGAPGQSVRPRDASTGGRPRTPENQSLPNRGTPLSNDIPQVLRDQDKYRVIRLLGRGGMGAVYEAHHERMDRQVAIKVISPEIISNPEAVKRFDQEIRAAAKLDHPNVARAYDADTFGPLRALVMEFVQVKRSRVSYRQMGP